MVHRILLQHEAKEDILEAWVYYEAIRKGLGDLFEEAVNHRLFDLARHPNHYSYLSYDARKIYRSVMLNRFPFQIIYGVHKNEVIIYGIIHVKRHPAYVFKRL